MRGGRRCPRARCCVVRLHRCGSRRERRGRSGGRRRGSRSRNGWRGRGRRRWRVCVTGELFLVAREPRQLPAHCLVMPVEHRTPVPVANGGKSVGGADNVGEHQGGEHPRVIDGDTGAGQEFFDFVDDARPTAEPKNTAPSAPGSSTSRALGMCSPRYRPCSNPAVVCPPSRRMCGSMLTVQLDAHGSSTDRLPGGALDIVLPAVQATGRSRNRSEARLGRGSPTGPRCSAVAAVL
jgi:hypothetical protein